MTQLYYRDLRRRVAVLEAQYIPEPEPVVTVYTLDSDGLPDWVCTVGRSNWMREKDQPIPPKYLKYGSPEARAAYEAATRKEAEDRPPPGD